jgi:hypothetical protein
MFPGGGYLSIAEAGWGHGIPLRLRLPPPLHPSLQFTDARESPTGSSRGEFGTSIRYWFKKGCPNLRDKTEGRKLPASGFQTVED